LADRIYLDHAATTRCCEALAAVDGTGMRALGQPVFAACRGRAARAALEDARRRIAAAYGWAHELMLTSGASESLHWR
jgi:cysteine desulfurase